MKKFEYKTIKVETSEDDMTQLDDWFNDLGSEGWELITTANDDSQDDDGDTYTEYLWYTFKRVYSSTKTYEYQTFRRPVDNVSLSLRKDWFNELGAEGWELATSVCDNSMDSDGNTYTEYIWYTLKRDCGSQKHLQFRIEKAVTTNVDLSLRNERFDSLGNDSWRIIAAAPDDFTDNDGGTYTKYIWYTFIRQIHVYKEYEYKNVLANTDYDYEQIDEWFDELGAKGWELAVASSDNSMDDDGDTYTENIWYTFIRQKNKNKCLEYFTTKISTCSDVESVDETFDELGAKGWELVVAASDNSMDDDGDTYTKTIWYTFKRER